MSDEDQRELLEELWLSVVMKPAAELGFDITEPRPVIACRLLLKIAEIDPYANPSLAGESIPDQFFAALPIWQLLAHDLGGWTLKSGYNGPASPPGADDRSALGSVLKLQRLAEIPIHSEAIDPVPVLLPRRLRKRLIDGLDALATGDKTDIFEPHTSGRHNTPWSWDQLRAGALDRVAFRRGQGFSAGDALEHVAQAMGVSAQTLRGWERSPNLKKGYDLAYAAGRLKSQLDDDPDFGKRPGQSVDAHVLERLNAFQAEPLAAFARRYRQEFGHRHNQEPNGGD